jgi:hypothetical protein
MRKRASRDRMRSTHVEVLASLEAVIARHSTSESCGGADAATMSSALPSAHSIDQPADDGPGATVLAFRPRLRLAPALGPDGAA